MPLPVSDEYLSLAFADQQRVDDMTLHIEPVGELDLPSGQLVACDPFVLADARPFNTAVPPGHFPVHLSIAHIGDDQRVAFATIRFKEAPSSTWRMLTVGDQDISKLAPGSMFCYPVDSGTGCFMDPVTARVLASRMDQDSNFYETLSAEMDKTYRHTWSWLNTRLGQANLIAFSSGDGDGVYATYGAFDSAGDVCAVVTDFMVVPDKQRPETEPEVPDTKRPRGVLGTLQRLRDLLLPH